MAITIVTFNSARYIRQCLEYVFALSYPKFEVILLDNASCDETPFILRQFEGRARVIYNRQNNGFAGGQNAAIEASNGEWVLTLNPDCRLTSNFLTEAVRAGQNDPAVGAACGKLLTMTPDFNIPAEPHFDSTGIYFTPNLRHLDRGSGEPDRGQYEETEYVFGATGAAALYRREMINDVAFEGEFFDEEFFAYREDADVAWRAQLLGWKCSYVASAVAYHVRSVLPSNRQSLPSVLNMHSVKNRFLMRIKNSTWPLYRRHGIAMTVRDVAVIAACFSYEFHSLRAFALLFRYWPRALRKRRDLMRRRLDPKRRRPSKDADIVSWFSYTPVSYPANSVRTNTSA